MDKIEHNFPPEQHHTYFRRLLPTVKRVSDGMSVWVIEGQRKFLSSTERERQQHLKIFTKTSSKQKLIHATHLR